MWMALICGLFQGTTHNMFLATHRAAWHAGALPSNYVSKTTSTTTATAPFLDSNYIEINAARGSNSASTRMPVINSPTIQPGTATSLYCDFWIYLPSSVFSGTGITSTEQINLVSMGDDNPLTSVANGSDFQLTCYLRSSTDLLNKIPHTDTNTAVDCSIMFELTQLSLSTGSYSYRQMLALTPSDAGTFAGWNRFVFYYSAFDNAFSDQALTSNPLFYNPAENRRSTKMLLSHYGTNDYRIYEEYDDTNRYSININTPSYWSFATVDSSYVGDKLRMGPTYGLTNSTDAENAWISQVNTNQGGIADYPRGRIEMDGAISQWYFPWVGTTDTERLTGTGSYNNSALDDDSTGSLTTGSI